MTDDAATAATSMPPRNAKHRKARKKKNARGETSTALSPQELAHHVAHQYLHGSGGMMRTTLAKAARRKTNHDQATYLRMLDRHPALVLNADYQPMSSLPLSLWNWQEAVKAIFSGKVTVVDVYPDVLVRAANLEIPLPSVIALNEYVPQFDQV